MRSSMLCLAILLISSCYTTADDMSTTSVSTTESQSTDYTKTEVQTEQANTKGEKITATPEPTTTTTTTKPVPQTCPTCRCDCSHCLLGLTVEDHWTLVIGGLALGCLILLSTTVALACKVCRLKREYGSYRPCHTDDFRLINGKRSETAAGKNQETAVMMTEVCNENKTATEDKERKQEEDDESAGSEKRSEEKDGSGESDTVKDDPKQAESNATEASEGTAAAETVGVAAGREGDVEPSSGGTEGTPGGDEA